MEGIEINPELQRLAGGRDSGELVRAADLVVGSGPITLAERAMELGRRLHLSTPVQRVSSGAGDVCYFVGRVEQVQYLLERLPEARR